MYDFKYNLVQLKWAVSYRYPPRTLESSSVVCRLTRALDLLALAVGSKPLDTYHDDEP
jgi:hypothetical protein